MRLQYLLLLSAIFLLSTGCAKQQFSAIEKSKALSNPVFASNVTTNIEEEIGFFCSNSWTTNIGYTLSTANNLELQIIDKSGNIICRNHDANLKSSILSEKQIPIKTCAKATGLEYQVRLVDLDKASSIKVAKNGDLVFNDLINFSSQSPRLVRTSTSEPFDLKRDKNYRDNKIEVVYASADSNSSRCDRSASPLIIKTENEDYGGIELTSQEDGINFNILGYNSNPFPNAKKRISWITKSSYMFLVKPNARNQVLGIDQMFGDNTLGPDGEFADNGYAALAKYDLNKDQVIDSKDPVYKKLKLWSDKNFDGRSQSNELISLVDAGLQAIDLQYDDSYSERDQYGNQTKMKSVVKYADGSYRLIFDLWFNYVGKHHR